MKKWLIIILIIIIIVSMALAIIKVVSINKNNKIIREGNVIAYNFLKCVSDCSIIENEYGKVFEIGCLNQCNSQYKIPTEYKKIIEGTLFNSEEVKSCNKFLPRQEKDKYVECLKPILPILKEKYNV